MSELGKDRSKSVFSPEKIAGALGTLLNFIPQHRLDSGVDTLHFDHWLRQKIIMQPWQNVHSPYLFTESTRTKVTSVKVGDESQ